jgi:hypothetical protein
MAVVAAVRYTHFAWRYRQTGDTEPGSGLRPAIFFRLILPVPPRAGHLFSPRFCSCYLLVDAKTVGGANWG